MAGAIDSGRKKGALNVELNIVPFVDVMSCLTAFLLVSAVWVANAQLKSDAHTKGGGTAVEPKAPSLAVLVTRDAIVVEARPSGERRELAAFDWPHFEQALKSMNPDPAGEPVRVDIAAESTDAAPISYQQLIAAMDTSLRAGFSDVGVVDPHGLF